MMLSGFLVLLLLRANAFQLPPTRPLSGSTQSTSHNLPSLAQLEQRAASPAGGPLYFWGKNKGEEGETPASSSSDDEKEGKGGEESGRLPFFAGLRRSRQTSEGEQDGNVATAEPTKISPPKKAVQAELDPVANAQSLRAQAERFRLEAERMDAELTLRKIARLEKELAGAVAKDDTENIEKIQREMDALQARMRGEAPKPSMPSKKEDSVQALMDEITTSASTDVFTSAANQGQVSNFIADINVEDVEETAKDLEKAPGFLKKIMAQMVEVDFDTKDDINCTEVAVRVNRMKKGDFSYSKLSKPTFSQAQIDEAKREIKNDPSLVDMDILKSAKGNETETALLYLNYGYYMEKYIDEFDESSINKLVEGEDWLKEIVDAVNKTAVDAVIENLYPKCTRKEDTPLPTMAQVQTLVSDVLPKASFTPRGKPEQVLGGYIVRGSSRYEKGDEILDAIEKQMAKSNLKDKMTVLVTKDFTLLTDDEMIFQGVEPDREPPVLYVMGPDILPERRRIPLAFASAFGIASCWYLSIYPFLLNPTIMKRTEEQLALADASMAYDLGWLTELALPLFFTFVGIQVANESGKRIAASLNEVELTLPTFVPSLVTGITSSVTQFKTLPKNKEALFDISFAGPVTGVLASVAALAIGSQLTLVSDPSLLPALPLDILRQSTLGGGIIDAILGAGALGIPEGAAGSQAVAGMTVSLHPVAVAGYIGLILNSLALLPIGTTDGGRIALALYGRGVKLFVGNIMLFTVFLVGLLGSDLFLFYFAFIIAFQTGNEVPARNEVDNISFARVCLAIGSTVVSLLALIPFQ